MYWGKLVLIMDGNLTQEELDALLNNMNTDSDSNQDMVTDNNDGAIDGEGLSSEEMDAIGEIANICSGSSATNLSTILNQRVNITTPFVTLESIDELVAGTSQPCVLVQIQYTDGIKGSNIQILQKKDVKIIADLMMGGDGTNLSALGEELTELHMSALCEAMNQMTGAAATSLYTMLNCKVDISPPTALIVDLRDEAVRKEIFGSFDDSKYVKVSFKLEIGDLIDSSYMQIYTLDFAKNLYNLIYQGEQNGAAAEVSSDTAIPVSVSEPAAAKQENTYIHESERTVSQDASMDMNTVRMNNMAGVSGQPVADAARGMSDNMDNSGVIVRPAEFNEFDTSVAPLDKQEQIGIINDVSLEIAVELGKTRKTVREILDFEEGTLIELDRLAGEMMDILVNGKVLAKGEIVVLEDKFAVQLKEINT